MEELPIGSEIILEVVEDNSGDCNGCFFNDLCGDIYEDPCKHIRCSASERKDKKSVKYIRVEDV